MAPEEQISLFELQDQPVPPAVFDVSLIPTSAKVSIPSGTYEDMDQIKAHCSHCQRCGLGEGRTNAVIGRGNPQAVIMVIGEGPGQTEDETGLPFVGKAGQLLEKILASVRLSSAEDGDVYIANVVKCRPADNRPPTLEEMTACRPYLIEQIRMVDPQIILLAGATAVKGLTGDKRSMTSLRGQWLTWEGRLYMPIFHPSYLLRNASREKGSPKWQTWQDIQMVRAKFDEIKGLAPGAVEG